MYIRTTSLLMLYKRNLIPTGGLAPLLEHLALLGCGYVAFPNGCSRPSSMNSPSRLKYPRSARYPSPRSSSIRAVCGVSLPDFGRGGLPAPCAPRSLCPRHAVLHPLHLRMLFRLV